MCRQTSPEHGAARTLHSSQNVFLCASYPASDTGWRQLSITHYNISLVSWNQYKADIGYLWRLSWGIRVATTSTQTALVQQSFLSKWMKRTQMHTAYVKFWILKMTFIDNTSKKSCLYRSNADQYTCHHRYSTACPNSSVSIYHSSHDPHARHFQVNVLFICLSSCFPVICIGHMPVYCVLLISCIWLPIRLSDDQMSDLNAPACCHLSCYSLAAYSMERGCHNYRFNW